MFELVCLALAALVLLPVTVYLQAKQRSKRVRPKMSSEVKNERIVTSQELPPSESGKWRVEPIMRILKEAKERRDLEMGRKSTDSEEEGPLPPIDGPSIH